MRKLRFLIIRLRAIGDTLISTCMAETLKTNFPKSQIDYIVYENCSSMLANNPFIDNIIVIPGGKNKNIVKMLKAILFLRKQKYDYAIDVINIPKSLILSKLSGARRTIGSKAEKYRDRFYDIKISIDNTFMQDALASKTTKQNLQLLTPINNCSNFIAKYRLYFIDHEINSTKKELQGCGMNLNKPFVFFGVNSSMPDIKSWPIENFVEVINFCHETYNIQTISYPGPAEINREQFLRSKLKSPGQHIIVESQSLRKLAITVKLSTLFIGNNSAPMHIALATDTPSISIFAPHIHYLDWHPDSDHRHKIVSIKSVLNYTEAQYEQYIHNYDIQAHNEEYTKITTASILQTLSGFSQLFLENETCISI